MQTYPGSCHCGKVKFEVTADISRGRSRCLHGVDLDALAVDRFDGRSNG